MNVHCGSILTGNVRIFGHLCNYVAEMLGKTAIPSAGEGCGGGETDGIDLGEVYCSAQLVHLYQPTGFFQWI